MNTMYDLAVIGTGPAGRKAAINAAKLGKRVIAVEREGTVGGSCIHSGTIPSKAVREAVLHLTGFRMRGIYGASYIVKQHITMADLIERSAHVVRHEVDVVKAQFQRNHVDLVHGQAQFKDPHTLRVVHRQRVDEIAADHILIACGTRPARPASVPFDPGRVIDSNELLALDEIPRSMIIVGGGVIGVEYACMLAVLGVRVTLIDRRPRLLEFVDAEIAEALQYHMRQMGVRLRLGEAVAEVRSSQEGLFAVLESEKAIRAQTILYAIGRQGSTDELNLDAAGLRADERGRLEVDDAFRTQAPHIFAAGDVVGFPALASTSAEQGRVASSNAFGMACESQLETMPFGIYTIPEISMVGPNEEALTAAQVPYEVGVARYREIARGQLMGDDTGMLKLIFHQQTRQLLAIHILGDGATELVHVGQAVLAMGGRLDYFLETVFNYPTLAECYKVAALDGINRNAANLAHSPRPASATPDEPENARQSPRRDHSPTHQRLVSSRR